MWWENSPSENHTSDAMKPPDDVLVEFKDLAMITWMSSCGKLPAQWINWAIDYTGSNMDYVVAFKDSTFKEIRVLHEAALKYLEDK